MPANDPLLTNPPGAMSSSAATAELGDKTSTSKRTHWTNAYRIDNLLIRQFLAEFVGTMILIVIGDGSVAQSMLSDGAKGAFLSINLAWAFAVMIAVYVSGGVSGGHVNPAISLAQCVMGNLPWSSLPVYFLAQYLGAFTGAAVVHGTYIQYLVDSPLNLTDTRGIFATYPAPYLDWAGGIGDQLVGTWLLAIGVAAITDPRNSKVPSCLAPLLVGLVVGAIGMSYGVNCGYAINPARDLGPRLWTLVAGWGSGVFSARDWNWFWVPIVGPHIGAIVGFLTYNFAVGAHWPDED